MKTKTSKKVLLSVLFLLVSVCLVLCATMATKTVNAAQEATTPTPAERQAIKGLSVNFNTDMTWTSPLIYADKLEKSYNEGDTANKVAIFEYVLEKGTTATEGAGKSEIHWGDNLNYGYGGLWGGYNHANQHYTKVWNTDTVSPFVNPANEGKRIFVLMQRASWTFNIYALDKDVEPIFNEDATQITNGTAQTFTWTTGTWNGNDGKANGGVGASGWTSDCRTLGFNFASQGVELSDLKCYNHDGANLGILFSTTAPSVTNPQAPKGYWMTGTPADTTFAKPINMNYGHPVGNETTTGFDVTPGQASSGYYSQYDQLFTIENYGNGFVGTAQVNGSLAMVVSHDQAHHKVAVKGTNLDITNVGSLTFRVFSNVIKKSLAGTDHNAINLFALDSTDCQLNGSGNDQVVLTSYLPDDYATTAVNGMVEITVPASEIAKLADANGDIKGFQLVMVNGTTNFRYFGIDEIRINLIHNIAYNTNGGAIPESNPT